MGADAQDGTTTHPHDVEGVVIEILGGIERSALGLCVDGSQELICVASHTAFIVFQGC